VSKNLACGLWILLVAGACTTDQPKALAVADAGSPHALTPHDAGATADAGGAPPVDAGAAAAAHAVGALGTGAPPAPIAAPPEHAAAKPAKGSVYDRVLVKPKERGAHPQDVKALIEKKTGLKVELARKTAGSWVLIQLAAAPGGRTERDQREAIEQLERLGVFEVVEADRLMKVKVP